jgi:predicted phosphodiesterase
MRYAILADIHSNLAAFQAVLNDLETNGGFDEIWCLGDIVGYGPAPHECIELLNRYKHTCVAGNHDWASIEKIGLEDFNPYAVVACQWTGRQLTDNDINFLKLLPEMIVQDEFTMVHGSPRDPLIEYILSEKEATENLKYFATNCCLVGHSHIPLVFKHKDNKTSFIEFGEDKSLSLSNTRFTINPGAVGQPRDNDPRANYALYDTNLNSIYHAKVNYDFKITQQKMEKVGLPDILISRLSDGW